jgi:GNAT superfamily N-acetyltransferase
MIRIKPMTQKFNRADFDSGSFELNVYLKKTARQHCSKEISKTFVIIDDEKENKILGFYTLCACEIISEKLPKKYAKKYPAKIPAAKLARLAVTKKSQRQGLGGLMMSDAFRRALSISEHLGIVGFFVDAKDPDAKKYYLQYGFIELPGNPLELFLPMSTIKELFKS